MANFDRIDLMNFVKYGNDFDDQWDEIRNYIKNNPQAQREVEDIKKSLPQVNPHSRRRMENFERSMTSDNSEESYSSQTTPSAAPTSPSPSGTSSKKWWNKLLGED